MLLRRRTSRPLVAAKVELGPPAPPNEFGGGTRGRDCFWLSMVERLAFLEIPVFTGMTYGSGFQDRRLVLREIKNLSVSSVKSVANKASVFATLAFGSWGVLR